MKADVDRTVDDHNSWTAFVSIKYARKTCWACCTALMYCYNGSSITPMGIFGAASIGRKSDILL